MTCCSASRAFASTVLCPSPYDFFLPEGTDSLPAIITALGADVANAADRQDVGPTQTGKMPVLLRRCVSFRHGICRDGRSGNLLTNLPRQGILSARDWQYGNDCRVRVESAPMY